MRVRLMTMLLLGALGACSAPQKFSVYFEAYSAELDQQARATVDEAASYAQAHPALPVALTGYSAPPDPKLDVEGLSAKRAAIVKQVLVDHGVAQIRISTVANGVTDPKSLPSVAVRRVDIMVGF